MKIHYIYHLDANRPCIQSGRPSSILQAFHELGVEVERIFPLEQGGRKRRLLKKLLWRATGHNYLTDREPEYLADLARQAEAMISANWGDVIFSPSTLPIAKLRTELPITFCADASFALMVDYYAAYSNLSAHQVAFAEKCEADVLRNAALAVYPSTWAAQSAIQHYGLREERVAVIPFGANFGKNNQLAEVDQWIEQRKFDEIRLLFVGKEWIRKGGVIAVETARLLNERGVRTRLDIVGAEVPRRLRRLSFVHSHGLLNDQIPTESAKLKSLFSQAHLLCVPSRAEAFGMVYCEANAFGVPAIATTTGGIGSIIRDGFNGFLLPCEAEAVDYANAITCAIAHPDQYRALARSSYREFSTRLNWRTFTTHYLRLLEERIFKRTGIPDGWVDVERRTP